MHAVTGPNRTAAGIGIGNGVLAPAGFLVAYLAVGTVSGALADRDLPLPGSPPSAVADYFAANAAAVGATAALQVASVVCLAVFVAALASALRAAGAGWVALAGYLSVAAMVVSSALSITLAALVPSIDDATVELLRQSSFYAGGVAAVVLLGVFVVGSAQVLGRALLFGAPTRWFGVIAGGLAVLSVLSLAFYYASALLPVGRVLSMVWTIVAGIVVYRHVRDAQR